MQTKKSARARYYLLAYDIACPRRLGRVHRYLKKQGLGVQYSVFLVALSQRRLNSLLRDLAHLILASEDDVRLYPVRWPQHFWVAGTSEGLVDACLLLATDSVVVPTGNSKRKSRGSQKGTRKSGALHSGVSNLKNWLSGRSKKQCRK